MLTQVFSCKQVSLVNIIVSLNSVFDMISLDISDKVRLFDSKVIPIVCYRSEVLGFHKAVDIKRGHTKFLKQLLSVRQQTSNVYVYGETGRFPLYVYRQIRLIKYWFKLISSRDSLMYSLYNLKSNNGAFTNSWTNNVHNLLRQLGLPYMIEYCQSP